MNAADYISVIMLVVGLLLIFFTNSKPLTFLAFGLIIVGAVLSRISKRKQ